MDRPNVLLIGADALRADHLSCYGYDRSTSPRIDALAAEGALCERLICQSIPTLPSFTTRSSRPAPETSTSCWRTRPAGSIRPRGSWTSSTRSGA